MTRSGCLHRQNERRPRQGEASDRRGGWGLESVARVPSAVVVKSGGVLPEVSGTAEIPGIYAVPEQGGPCSTDRKYVANESAANA